MDVRSALARMTRAAVHLADQTPAIGQVDLDRGPDGWSARPVGPWMTLEHHGLVTGLGADRQPQMKAQEGAGVGSGVAEEERRLPLVGHREVESAIAIDVRQRDAARHHRGAQSQLVREIVETAVRSPHKEAVVIAATEVGSRSKVRPEPGV